VNDDVGRVWNILWYYPRVLQEELRKISPVQELDPDPSEYKQVCILSLFALNSQSSCNLLHNLCS
jgi:hypothetical protein